MCNEIARRIALGQLRDDWSQTKVPLVFPEGLPNLGPEPSIRITDSTLILRAADDTNDTDEPGAAGVVRRWSWPGAGGRPVYNYRSDGRDLKKGRCLIPVDGFYEFTAPDDPKQLSGSPRSTTSRGMKKDKWLFTHASDPWFCLAGLWRATDDVGEAFTILTTEPGPDIAPYHSRQVVGIDRADYAGWLDGSIPSADLCRPAPAGTLAVERMR